MTRASLLMSLTLDRRLAAVAAYVRDGSRLADIGTDHGYLPAFLIMQQRIPNALACDINEQPLESAARTFQRYGLSGVQLRCCDGLAAVSPDECDDIAIAGMGGELIAQIISRAEWLKNSHYRLILQPMSKADRLRRFLCAEGYAIDSETAVSVHGKHYTVICAHYSGEAIECSELFALTGALQQCEDDEAVQYRSAVLRRMQRKAAGLARAGGDTAPIERLIAQLQR